MSNGDLSDELSDFSMLELFRSEAESQVAVLTSGLLALEQGDASLVRLADLMRAAHSLKGAAKIVGADHCAEIAHLMEDCFVAAQRGELTIGPGRIDILLKGADLLGRLSKLSEAEMSGAVSLPEIDDLAYRLAAIPPEEPAPVQTAPAQPPAELKETAESVRSPHSERSLRIQSEQVDRLLGVAAESMIESRRMYPALGELLRHRRMLDAALRLSDELRSAALDGDWRYIDTVRLALRTTIQSARSGLIETMEKLDTIYRRTDVISGRLYDGTLKMRMRPFGDILQAMPRLVRDTSRALGKEARLEFQGEHTEVDREALERLETILGHLIRNALDHGIESPEAREAAGKPREGVLRIDAAHDAGMLRVRVRDDGRGVDLEVLRESILRKNFTDAANAEGMSESELLEFLFLPGFSIKDTVTDISGRGVGLDAVQAAIRDLRGTVRVYSQPGEGVEFELHLPLTLSVLRAVVLQINGAPYGIPLARTARVLSAPVEELRTIEGRQMLMQEGRSIGLIPAGQLLGLPSEIKKDANLSVVCLESTGAEYGVVVDRFAGVREVVVQPLDHRLGKIPCVSAGALLPDGEPILLLDVDDLLHAAEKLCSTDMLAHVRSSSAAADEAVKRILVVDDSLTVRELERKLLQNRGYHVEIAVDGMEAWHLARAHDFDLVVTDVDMPRLDGIELTKLIKADPLLGRMPVMIVSYKDREEDRMRGMEAGADYYLAKGNFQDDKLLGAVEDLIGAAK